MSHRSLTFRSRSIAIALASLLATAVTPVALAAIAHDDEGVLIGPGAPAVAVDAGLATLATQVSYRVTISSGERVAMSLGWDPLVNTGQTLAINKAELTVNRDAGLIYEKEMTGKGATARSFHGAGTYDFILRGETAATIFRIVLVEAS